MTLSLGIALILIALILPYAQLAEEDSLMIDAPQAVENFDQIIDMGPDYGQLSVIDLMGFYIENPPQTNSEASSAPKRHFGGC